MRNKTLRGALWGLLVAMLISLPSHWYAYRDGAPNPGIPTLLIVLLVGVGAFFGSRMK